MSRTRDVTNALIAKLGADDALLALMPNGVYRLNRAPEGATALVTVALGAATDHPMFNGRADEDLRYTVLAMQRVQRGQSPSNVGAAASRIDALLEDGTLDSADFGVMVMQRQVYLEDDGVTDPRDPSIAWDVCGGIYQVMVTTATAAISTWMQGGWVQEGWTQ